MLDFRDIKVGDLLAQQMKLIQIWYHNDAYLLRDFLKVCLTNPVPLYDDVRDTRSIQGMFGSATAINTSRVYSCSNMAGIRWTRHSF